MLLIRRAIICIIVVLTLTGYALAHDPLVNMGTDLNTLITESRTGSEIILDRNATYTLTANLVIQSGTVLVVPQGTLIQLGTYDLTIGDAFWGPLDHIVAGKYKIFDVNSSGRVLRIANTKILPEWFGAIGDGDTANKAANRVALQYCFDLLTSGQFQKVIELDGRYVIDTTITSTLGYTELRGTGLTYGSQIILHEAVPSNAAILAIDDSADAGQYYFSVLGVLFDRATDSTDTYWAPAIYVNMMDLVTIKDCTITAEGANYNGYGIYWNKAIYGVIQNNRIQQTKYAGILAIGAAGTPDEPTELMIRGNYIRDSLAEGIRFESLAGTWIRDNAIWNTQTSVKLNGSGAVKVQGNDLDTTDYSLSLTDAYSCQFDGNWMSNVDEVAVLVEPTCANLQFANNHIYTKKIGYLFSTAPSGAPGSNFSITGDLIFGIGSGGIGTTAIAIQAYEHDLNLVGNKILFFNYGVDAHAATGLVNIAENQFQGIVTSWLYNNAANEQIRWAAGGDNLNQIDDLTTYTLASANPLTLPQSGNAFTITGTTNIYAILGYWANRQVSLVFSDVLTVVDGSNLLLNGDFVSTAGSVLVLVCRDGTNWVEVSRAGSGYAVPTAANWTDLTDAGNTTLHKHDIYPLLAGKLGGQTLIGGTDTTDDMILRATAGVGVSGSDMIFQVGNNGATEAMRVFYDGKVSIGTATSGQPLDVQSSAIGTGIRALNSYALGDYSGGYFRAATTLTPDAADRTIGSYFMGGITTGTTYQTPARMIAKSAEAWDTTHAGAYLTFWTTPTGGSVTPAERLRITDAGKSQFGTIGTNYSEFETDGTLVFNGDATVWEDLRISAETTKVGSSAPDFDTFITGTKIYWFDAGTDQEVHFAVQLPHSWAGTAITPHVHWVPKTTSDGDPASQAVRWGIEYTWAEPGAVFPGVLTVYTVTHSPADADVVANKYYMSSFTAITPSSDQDGISSMIICRLFRDANDVADTYEVDAGLLEIDFHYEMNTIGSRTIGAK